MLKLGVRGRSKVFLKSGLERCRISYINRVTKLRLQIFSTVFLHPVATQIYKSTVMVPCAGKGDVKAKPAFPLK